MEKNTNQIEKKIDTIRSEYGANFQSNFYSTLYTVLYATDGKQRAFTALHRDNGLMLAFAVKGQNGYFPTEDYFKAGIKYDQAMDIVDDLNRDVFGLTIKDGQKIVASTMQTISY